MSAQVEVRSTGVDHTRRLAASLGELIRAGDIVVLVGDLGAGKTAFAQGLGAGLGVTDTITSPTFALVQSYSGRLDLHHLDVYRLEQINQALDLGLAELLDDDAVMVIEWGDTIAPVLPHNYLEVRLAYGADDNERLVSFSPVGSRWSARMRAIATVIGRPADDPVGGSPPTKEQN